MDLKERCGNCRYFWENEIMNEWACRRFPPQCNHESEEDRQPLVGENDWCGEWREM